VNVYMRIILKPSLICYVTDRAGVQPIDRTLGPPAPTGLDLQLSHTKSFWCLMVATLVIHVSSWITSHLLTLEGWKATLAWLADA